MLRLKRLRQTKAVRSMIQETRLHRSQLIMPLFISATLSKPQAIQSMSGLFQLPLDAVLNEIEDIVNAGIKAIILFGIPATKDADGSASLDDQGIIQQAIKLIKSHYPDLLVIADVCLCEYTNHGHCGLLEGEKIDNDRTLAQLGKQAVSFAKAGVDWVAPSSMTDGMVDAIRTALDEAGYTDVAILSYAVKYSSYFYGPFREAAQGAPQFGDRKTYQMDFSNANEAIREAMLDIQEGADLLMVKPAMNYLDIIYRIKSHFPEVPLCAYQVSGEYAMIKGLAERNLVNENQAIIESLTAIKRAGADLIITYFAKQLALTGLI